MSKRKLLVAYVCLVGGPLLGLLGILRAGEHLTAPVSVGGDWYLEANTGVLPSASCRDLLARVNQPFLNVSQSGTNLVFIINNPEKTTQPGLIRGATLTMRREGVRASDATNECKDPQAIYLDATVDTHGGQRVLTGALRIDGCASCPPISFRAVRQVSQGRGGV